jgi:fructosamine-3-kinase
MPMTALLRAAERLTGREPVRAEVMHGGDLSQVLRVWLADGGEIVVKNGPAPLTEAAMLRAVAATGAPAPRVLAADESILVMTLLPHGGRLSASWADLGRALGMLHAAPAPVPEDALPIGPYGWEADYAYGRLGIDNGWKADWCDFWAEKRLLAGLEQLPVDLARRLEALAARLPEWLPRQPRPSLLHGDLWGGNVVVAEGKVSGFVDPASYVGHGEVDVAMLGLFDSPPSVFFTAYIDSIGPPEPGLGERLILYRLWPAIVHYRLFGLRYRGLVDQLLAAVGA